MKDFPCGFPELPLDAVFFDLDGTLLPLDTTVFLKRYADTLDAFARSRGVDVEMLHGALKAGTAGILSEDTSRTNAERFAAGIDAAIAEMGVELDWASLLDEYFAEVFPGIGPMFPAAPESRRAVEELKEKGYPVVLATMPIFPRVSLEARLGWAGLDYDLFDHVTHLENSTSIKPRAAYYGDCLARVGAEAGRTLMIGNDTRDDYCCTEAGLQCTLLTDDLIDRGNYDLAKIATMAREDLPAFVRSLPDHA